MLILALRAPPRLVDPSGVLPIRPRRPRLAGVGELTLADLHDAHDDDEGERQELAGGEHVLHPGGPPHAGAVHPCEQH